MASRPQQSQRRQRTATRTASAAVPPVITVRAIENELPIERTITRAAATDLQNAAQQWTYVLRARTRWAHDLDQRKVVGARALTDLGKLGISRDFIQRLALVRRVEVELHPWDGKDSEASQIHEAASEIPWEYLISVATRAEGRFEGLLITRLFRNQSAPVGPIKPRDVLFVESAPGRIDAEYSFDDEEERIDAAIGVAHMEILPTPPLEALGRKAREKHWHAIHVTGIDTHQAAWLVKDFYKDFDKNKPAIWQNITDQSGRLLDGMILRERHVSELPVRYDQLADHLVNPKAPPRVVTLNLYYSGARTARELVRRGAYGALGFLDEIDDDVAEHFFQEFYWSWCHSDDSPVRITNAFQDAWDKVRSDRLHGTAIVIWRGRSLTEEAARPPARRGTRTLSRRARAARRQ